MHALHYSLPAAGAGWRGTGENRRSSTYVLAPSSEHNASVTGVQQDFSIRMRTYLRHALAWLAATGGRVLHRGGVTQAGQPSGCPVARAWRNRTWRLYRAFTQEKAAGVPRRLFSLGQEWAQDPPRTGCISSRTTRRSGRNAVSSSCTDADSCCSSRPGRSAWWSACRTRCRP